MLPDNMYKMAYIIYVVYIIAVKRYNELNALWIKNLRISCILKINPYIDNASTFWEAAKDLQPVAPFTNMV